MAERPSSHEEIGSFCARQYYIELQRLPEIVPLLYKNSSTMVRVDGDTIVTANTLREIRTAIASLNFISTEIRTVKSLPSMGGGIMVLLSGYVRMSNYNSRRKFVQSFFLAPQEGGYYLLNDIFHFLEEEFDPRLLENGDESVTVLSNSPPERQVSDSGCEDEATDFVLSRQLGDDYGSDEQQSVARKSPVVHDGEHLGFVGNRQSLHNDVIDQVCEGEPQKKTYASILRAAIGQPEASTSGQPLVNQSSPLGSKPRPVVQRLQVKETYVSETNEAIEYYSGQEDDGELNTVFVSKLPHCATAARLEQEFKQFGAIKPDGISIRRGPNNCYAFVVFESMDAVHAALQASPIELDGRQIHLHERRVERKSVFVRNLPYSVTAAQLEREFKQFGTIKPNGIFIGRQPGIDVCYAFVSFESMAAVHAALQGSPMEFDGNKIYIEKQRAKASGASPGGERGGRGRGRGSSWSDGQRGGASGRGSKSRWEQRL